MRRSTKRRTLDDQALNADSLCTVAAFQLHRLVVRKDFPFRQVAQRFHLRHHVAYYANDSLSSHYMPQRSPLRIQKER